MLYLCSVHILKFMDFEHLKAQIINQTKSGTEIKNEFMSM